MKRLAASFLTAALLLSGTGCRRVSLSDLGALLKRDRSAQATVDSTRETVRRRLATTPTLRSPEVRSRRVPAEAYVVDANSGPVYLNMAMHSGAPAFVLVNGRRVVHSTSPLNDPAYRLASRVEIDGRTLYTYRELH